MELGLAGRRALVTGASRGIGLAVVTALRAEGMEVVAGARTIGPGVEETGAIGVPVDLATPEGPALLVERATAELGGLDLLVNNVGGGDGGAGQAAGFLGFSDAQWQGTFDLNFMSAVRSTRAALPALTADGGGSIVNVSSVGARVPHSGPVPYTTAKAALTAFGKALAEEFGPRGVRVNTVSPGVVRTDMWEAEDGYGAALARTMNLPLSGLLAGLPAATGMVTGRLVTPAEVAHLVAYLASPLAGSVTGADHVIDGGSIKTA